MMPPSKPVARTLHLLLLLLLTPAMAFAQSGPKPVPKPAPPPDPLVRMNESMDALTKKVWPSVVQILVSSYGPRAEGMKGETSLVVGRQRSTGSGFVIDPDGYIMTNAHVVSGARRVQVVLPAGDADGTLATALTGKSTIVPARIVGITTELDLALLKVDDLKLPALPLATYSQVRRRDSLCVRQSGWVAQQPDARAGLGCGTTGRSRFAAHLHPDRRADQSREFRWPADGQPADNLPSVNYYFRLRDSTDNVQLAVLRGGADQKLSIATVEQRSEFDSVSALADPEKNLVPELGILGVEIDARIAAGATGLRDPYGIIVVARAAAPGSEVPLLPRDVIRTLNRKQMTTLQGLRDALRSVTPGSPVTLQIQREGRLMFVSFTLE
jgi:S1-C subfamily serine protease